MTFLFFRKTLAYCAIFFTVIACLSAAPYAVGSVGEPSAANTWQAPVAPHAQTPPQFIAVDKKRQLLMVFDRQTSPQTPSTYLCTTGQKPGDKLVEGDLKTPEGVYFVVQHLTSGLDYTLYGNEAYTLNYPNPVDRLRRKTGYGIWIHGRGGEIAPLQTQGCVSLNNSDVTTLGKNLAAGTPVILSSSLGETNTPSPNATKAAALNKLVHAWANAWGQRSVSMFDFYDSEAYSAATESFSHFRSNKERLFKSLPWIKNRVRDVQVLEGPGYWVTWFHQNYEAPNLQTKGVRRLYWAETPTGEFKIVGMEWLPGLSTGTLSATAESAVPPAEETPRTETEPAQDVLQAEALPAATSPPAASGAANTLSSSAGKQPGAEGTPPGKETAPVAGVGATMGAALSPSEPVAEVAQPTPIEPELPLPPQVVAVADQSERNTVPADIDARILSTTASIQAWRLAWENGDLDAYMAFYAPNAQQGNRKGKNSIRKQKQQLWGRAKPTQIIVQDIKVTVEPGEITAEMRQDYSDSMGKSDTGVKTLRFSLVKGQWLIKDETWSALN